jgi:hypothetical protein
MLTFLAVVSLTILSIVAAVITIHDVIKHRSPTLS